MQEKPATLIAPPASGHVANGDPAAWYRAGQVKVHEVPANRDVQLRVMTLLLTPASVHVPVVGMARETQYNEHYWASTALNSLTYGVGTRYLQCCNIAWPPLRWQRILCTLENGIWVVINHAAIWCRKLMERAFCLRLAWYIN